MQNDMSTAVMWSKSKPDVEFQYGRRFGEFNGMSSQSHVSHCRVLPVMYTVLSSLDACGCLGVAAAAAGVFVCHA